MQRIFDEIRMCLKNECYVAALALALTLPDVCGKAASPKGTPVGKRYTDWYTENVGDYRKRLFKVKDEVQDLMNAEEEVEDENPNSLYWDADNIYALRCALVHAGNTEVDESKERIKEVCLIVNDELVKEAYVGSVSENGEIRNICYLFDPKTLCNILLEAAERYYSSKEKEMSFAHIRIIDKKK